MKVDVEDGLDTKELLYISCQTFVIIVISFIHPWLSPQIDEKVKAKMKKSTLLNMLFVFSIGYSYTVNILHSLFICVLFFYFKSLLIKFYS